MLDEDRLNSASTAEIHSALFGQLVAGHAQMALVLLGKLPHPESGKPLSPLPEDGKMFIDQLEMLETKTRGNLTPEEAGLLQQALSISRQALSELIEARLDADSPPSPYGTPAGPADDGKNR